MTFQLLDKRLGISCIPTQNDVGKQICVVRMCFTDVSQKVLSAEKTHHRIKASFSFLLPLGMSHFSTKCTAMF
jgi:hypothetical protein